MTKEPGRIATRLIYTGRVVELSVDSVRFPDGSVGELELVRHPGASAIVPLMGSLEEDDPELVLVRQYRYAAGGPLYEIPAGLPKGQGESWEECARRELEEETGWRAGRMRRITSFYTTPGFTNEVIHVFLAWQLSPGRIDLDPDEFLDVVRIRLSEAIRWVLDGRIVDGKTATALLLAARHVGKGALTATSAGDELSSSGRDN